MGSTWSHHCSTSWRQRGSATASATVWCPRTPPAYASSEWAPLSSQSFRCSKGARSAHKPWRPRTPTRVDAATSGPEISDEEHEVVLSEEEVVVEKKAVPKERVRLGKETEVNEQEVTEEVRKERIEAEGEIES